jgi:hypothetical protein
MVNHWMKRIAGNVGIKKKVPIADGVWLFDIFYLLRC